jgi:glyceraldehyde 3-phosphate dehydrogenase
MAIKVGINGYGRIGRNVLRALYESKRTGELQIVAVNDLGDAKTNAHLTRYDTVHGRFPGEVHVDGDSMVVNGDRIRVLAERDPAKLPWGDLGVEVVLECTGLFVSKAKAGAHVKAGAQKVIISAPGDEDVDATIVYGVNHAMLKQSFTVISNASCTTNCVAPMAKVLQDEFGIERGFMTTIHAYTGDQRLLDAPHKDLRRARSAAVSIIPTSTGAAKATGEVIPALNGKLDGVAVRVPVEDGSLTDLAAVLSVPVTAEEVNDAFRRASTGRLAGVLRYSIDPLVSRDIVGEKASCVFDSLLTEASGSLVKVFGWYDNEWGYSCRLADLAVLVGMSLPS